MLDGNEEVAKDLLSFRRPILVMGDPAQLPPVKGKSPFASEKPDAMLTEICRQAEGNPIIAMSKIIREGKALQMASTESRR